MCAIGWSIAEGGRADVLYRAGCLSTGSRSEDACERSALATEAYLWYGLKNTGATSCSMIGYPRVAVLNAHGQIVPATRRDADRPSEARDAEIRRARQFLLNSTDTVPALAVHARTGVYGCGCSTPTRQCRFSSHSPAPLRPQSRTCRARWLAAGRAQNASLPIDPPWPDRVRDRRRQIVG